MDVNNHKTSRHVTSFDIHQVSWSQEGSNARAMIEIAEWAQNIGYINFVRQKCIKFVLTDFENWNKNLKQ